MPGEVPTDLPAEGMAEGRSMCGVEVIAWARRTRGERKRPAFGWDSLTPTEIQVVDAVASGLTNPQIATQLLMGRETVKTHRAHVYTELSIANRTQLAALAATNRPG